MGIIAELIKLKNERSSDKESSEDVTLSSDDMTKLRQGECILKNYKKGIAVLKIKEKSINKSELDSEDLCVYQAES